MNDLGQVILISGNHKEKGFITYIDEKNNIEVALEDGYKYLTKIDNDNSTYTDGRRCWFVREV